MAGLADSPDSARKTWRGIRPRLIGVLLVPTIAALIFGALRVQEAATESADTAQAESLASALPDSFRLAVQLALERDAAATGSSTGAADLREATDERIADWRGAAAMINFAGNEELQDDLSAISDRLDSIDKVRDSDDESAEAKYTATINRLLGLADRMPAVTDTSLYDQTYALTAVPDAFDALDAERELMANALAAGQITDKQRIDLVRAREAWADAAARFDGATSAPALGAAGSNTDDSDGQNGGRSTMQEAVRSVVASGDIDQAEMSPQQWTAATRSFLEEFESAIVAGADDVAGDLAQVRSDAQRSAVIGAVVTFLVLFAALMAATLAARSIVLPLRRLRRAALDIAQAALPSQVRRIEEADGPVDVSVEPIGIGREDEIGEVATAFDAVHAEAVRLAGEQAEMRANVNRMFVNLSRRSQNLVERQLRLIDELEEGEQDPDDLANLFQLDHLATRMRRNDESLLVLAGGETSHGSGGDTDVLDVLRAAASEIEQYARVQIDSTDSGAFRGRVAGDLVHLLAELIENATNFSPPDTHVVVRTARTAPDGAMTISVTDFGIAMMPDELAAANAKLRHGVNLTAEVARMMGLVVAARLAHRHGLSIELQRASPRGIVALVMVPASAFVGWALPESGGSRSWPQSHAAPPASSGWSDRPPSEWAVNDRGASGIDGAFAAMQSMAPGASSRGHPHESYATNREEAAVHHTDPLHDRMNRPDFWDDASPIFDSLRSEWFTPRGPVPDAAPEWHSPGDEGWRRAAEVSEQHETRAPRVTRGGLPQRVPGQHLVPGAAATEADPREAQEQAPPKRRREGLSKFQQGVSRARRGGDPNAGSDRPEGLDDT